MHTTLASFAGLAITPWKLVGFLGVTLFAGRWLVQMAASRAHGQPTVPLLFWYMSIAGSVLCLGYFMFGKNDSVGILSNALPLAVALYNLRLALRARVTNNAAVVGEVGGRAMGGHPDLAMQVRPGASS